jgi:hypothetical protein|eukprot:COSAG02_NODE_1334_length_13206_cov_8.144427_10_plen_147_part_00
MCVRMQEHVLPAVRQAVDGPSATDVEVDILDKVRAGEDGDAVLVVRGLLSEKCFAALTIPNRRHVLDSASVIAYKNSIKSLGLRRQQLLDGLQAGLQVQYRFKFTDNSHATRPSRCKKTDGVLCCRTGGFCTHCGFCAFARQSCFA